MLLTATPRPIKPTLPPSDQLELSIDLIDGEFREYLDAKTLIDRADALGDLLYVILWGFNIHGIDSEPIFNEIQRSNMTKLWTTSEIGSDKFDHECMTRTLVISPTTSDPNFRCYCVRHTDNGKALKSPSYSPANLKPIIEAQISNSIH